MFAYGYQTYPVGHPAFVTYIKKDVTVAIGLIFFHTCTAIMI